MEQAVERMEQLEALYNQATNDRERLLARVYELEDQLEDLNHQLRKYREPDQQLISKEALHLNNAHKETNAQEDEPWLFYCETGKSLREIKSILDFSDSIELEASALSSEEELWQRILEHMHGGELPNKLNSLRKLAAVQFASACHDQLLVIIRNIPRPSHGMFQEILPQIATLAEFVNIAWSEVENNNPDLLGRIALVLECEEEIKKLSVDRGDTRMSLYVERLR